MLNALDFMHGFCVLQRRLGDAAKKAISKLQVRTIKKGDKVSCALSYSYAAYHVFTCYLYFRCKEWNLLYCSSSPSCVISL